MSDPIAPLLLRWFDVNRREMPWRQTRDPYAIWISEVMLQQTQVDTVRPYWARFMNRFPTVRDLADAPLDDLLKAWEGLGYYSRARNLQSAARQVVDRHGGMLPADPIALRALTGIGPYTAGAVASIAFGLAEPAVDGNVIRVLARLHLLRDDATRPAGRARFEALARSLLEAAGDRPGDFNQALMELGALVCSARSPKCGVCPLRGACRALAEGMPEELPTRRKPARAPYADLAVAVCLHDDQVLVARRPPRGLLAGLMGFPTERLHPAQGVSEAVSRALAAAGLQADDLGHWMSYPFVFSSLRTTHVVHLARYRAGSPASSASWVDRAGLAELALPTSLSPIREALLSTPDWSQIAGTPLRAQPVGNSR